MGKALKIYFDCCALKRLTDEQSQSRIRAEAEAVERILTLVATGIVQWASSFVLEFEVSNNSDVESRREGMALLEGCNSTVRPNIELDYRSRSLERWGYDGMDAVHLARAEHTGADVLLTTDDRFLRRAMRGVGKPLVRVANPVDWWQEVGRWLQ